jgi:hypothetical protein
MVRSFRDLLVWQKAIQSSIAIYRLTQGFPREEIYGMTSQRGVLRFRCQVI